MTGSWEGFGYDKTLWKERRSHLLQFPDHKAMEKEISSKNLWKSKEKERAKNQAVTTLTPLKKSCPRDLVAEGISLNISDLKETISNSGILFSFIDCSHWLLFGFLTASGVVCFTVSTFWQILRGLFMLIRAPIILISADLADCDGLSWLGYITCLTNSRVISDWSSTDNLPWICDQIFPYEYPSSDSLH